MDGTDKVAATEWTVWHAVEIREDLLERLSGGDPVELDLGEVAEADLTGLQVLCSAHRTATARGKPFRVVRWSEAFERVIETAGFPRAQGCSDGCLWAREEKP